ncbi:MAG: orotate phosphoribosyltransferase [Clostridiales bacterium]|nr:orotate phosphoribosyltransferase [Clostridiales bacterium]
MPTIHDYLFATNAVRVSDPEKPFWYASGTLGPFYVNTHFLIESEDKANQLLALIEGAAAGDRTDFLNAIFPFIKNQYETSESYKTVIDLIVSKAKELDFDYISGGERRDFFFSVMPAYILGKPHVSIFKDGETYYSETVESKASKVEKDALSGKKALHIADLITEASSYTKAWIPSIRNLGSEITDTIAVINRLQGGEENLKKEGVSMYTFANIELSLFDDAVEKGVLSVAQRDMVAQFMKDPIEYMKAFLVAHPSFIDDQIALGGKPQQRAELAISRGYVPGRTEV